MKQQLLMGLMLLMTATAASAEWTWISVNNEFNVFVDKATIRRNGNLVKMWHLVDYRKVVDYREVIKTFTGDPYLSQKIQNQYDCKEEKSQSLGSTSFSGNMGGGNPVYSVSNTSEWSSVSPESVGEALWKIACGKK